MKLSTQPYKGSRDFYPEDFRIRKYIFDTFEKVCTKYGYKQYDGPFIESTEIYKAKSGQEIVDEQLYSFTDKGNREIAIRPEMTPTLARMVSGRYKELSKPIRWFSIPNVWRYEKPQKGRLREHYQLNVDIYGEKSVLAEAEILMIVIDILKEFGANKEMFKIRINNRKLMRELLEKLNISSDNHKKIFKIIDKKEKISKDDFINLLMKNGNLDKSTSDSLCHYIENPKKVFEILGDMSNNVREVKTLLNILKNNDLDSFVIFDPTIIRGLDYYTSFVFELFDLNPKNNRAMCGGGKYEGLLDFFINQSDTAVGFGMGDVTILNFLTANNLIPSFKNNTKCLVSIWPGDNTKYVTKSQNIAKFLRDNNISCILWSNNNTKIEKQIKYAIKNNIDNIIIIGDEEIETEHVTLKKLNKKEQIMVKKTELINLL